MLDFAHDCPTVIDPARAAERIGLRYVSDRRPGIGRQRSGKGFRYIRPDGSALSEPHVLARIRALAIPPAWTEVWICPFADGHIQVTGRDTRRRKQYRYHDLFREARDGDKFEHLLAFATALPAIRSKVKEHMSLRGLPREKMLAAVTHLLDTTLIRIGNTDYAKRNGGYGLTTLRRRHDSVQGAEVRFRFTGKSGRQWSLSLKDRRIAAIVRACQELPGQELLHYLDEEGSVRAIGSNDVNGYLKDITGRDITAKDFRTWAGTVLAALALRDSAAFDSATQAKRNLTAAIARVAVSLGNTPTICRKCYIHPAIVDAYLAGDLLATIRPDDPAEAGRGTNGLRPEETAVVTLLRAGFERDTRR